MSHPPFLGDLGDLFGELFGNAPELHVDLAISEDAAATGVVRTVEVRRAERCPDCEGRGTATPDEAAVACAACKGSGGSRTQTGFFVVANTCKTCHGRGRTIAHPCATCSGGGSLGRAATVTVRVPAGTTHGSTIRVAGEGSLRADGTPADLVAFVLVGDRADPRPRPQGPAPLDANPQIPMAQVYRPPGTSPAMLVGLVLIVVAMIALLAIK